MSNISSVHDCFGCGVCAASCGKKIISIKLNKDGFYEPVISDLSKCSDCGICLDVCAFFHDERATDYHPICSWGAWSNDIAVHKKCSSGGVAFEIGKYLLAKGYKVIGCRYDISNQRAEHYIASTVDELKLSIGSKYIQSFTEEAFRAIDRKQHYLVIGTPCQIDSFRRMIRKFHCEDNFILMDFFCHGVPSMLMWKAYIKKYEPIIGKVTYASWRNKFEYGWHDSWTMGLDGEKTTDFSAKVVDETLIEERDCFIKSRWTKGDLFYKLYLGDLCMGTQCQKQCKYKYDKSSADIRIGDMWGETYKNNNEGVSAIVAYSDIGLNIVKDLQNVNIIEYPFDIVAEGQVKNNVKPKLMKPFIMSLLRHNVGMDSLIFKITYNIQRIINCIQKRFKKSNI